MAHTAPTYKGVSTLLWGTDGVAVGFQSGYLESYDHDRAAGELKRYMNESGQTITYAFYDEKHPANTTWLTTTTTLPARGTAVTINSEYPHFVVSVKETGKQDDVVRFQIATEYASGITTA